MRVLNLYAGIGGNRKLWPENIRVTAVENNPEIAAIYQEHFPNDTVIVGDAHQYLLDHYSEFDFIWSSFPCTTHTRMNVNFSMIRYPDLGLYQEIIFLNHFFKGKFCVENVIPYYTLNHTRSSGSASITGTCFGRTSRFIKQIKGIHLSRFQWFRKTPKGKEKLIMVTL